MSEILPAAPQLAAFALASLVLAATPGPGVLYIVARTLAQGRLAGLASVAGVALGNLGNAVAAALGLAALFAVSALAFTIVKWAGAAYLVYLGVKALRAPVAATTTPAGPAPGLARIFGDGFWVALLNPKTTLFFAAFLPQFINPGAAAMPQSLLLGGAFVLMAACTDTLYVLAAAAAAPSLGRTPGGAAWGRWSQAAVYFGLGLYTAASGSRAGR